MSTTATPATESEGTDRVVEFTWIDGALSASIDDQVVVAGIRWPDDGELPPGLAAATEIPASPRTRLIVTGSPIERAKVLSALHPSDELDESLAGLDEDANSMNLDWEKVEVGPGLLVRDEPWAWLLADAEWKVVPRGFRDSETDVVRLSDWMSASMTGMVVDGGCVRCDPIALSWFWNDIDGLLWLSVDYAPGTPDELATDFFDMALGDYGTLCFVDEAEGWETDLTVGDGVSDEVFGAGLTRLRGPCADHDRPDLEERLEMGGSDWRWNGTTFVRDDGAPTDGSE